ncbi:hypothetical protein, partial [Synechococcus sp. CS-1332]|uniref:hypothetical protein n=1 Tax=Synechococcus sp. CS-1332 TaxID=2847972 RepID=UPI00223A77E4
VQLLRDNITDLVSVQINGVSSAVRLSGTQIKASQFADRQILAAETNAAGVNQILWKVVSTGQIRTWSLDKNWNFTSSNTLATPTSSSGLLLQQQFMVDASGTPLTPAPLNAALQTVDPIIGGGTSLAPDASDALVGAPATFDELLPADPTFTNTPILALGELASLGLSNPTELLASPFPAAGSASSPTTPWLVATQPLL